MTFHQVVSPVPIHAAPDLVPDFQLVAGHVMEYLGTLVLNLSDLESADETGVADLSSPSRVECGTAQCDPIAFDLCYLGLEFRNVAVVVEEFIRHGTYRGKRFPILRVSLFK